MQALKVGCVSARLKALSSVGLHCTELVKATSFRHVHHSVSRFGRTNEKADDTPIIRVPQYMTKRAENMREARSKTKVNLIKGGKLLIDSKHPCCKQSAGHTLGKFEQPVLASKGWKHKKSHGDHFTVNNIKDAAPCVAPSQMTEAERETAVTFENLHICKELINTLESIGITHPTTVQLQTIPMVMKGHNILCAAETGSGKTLSYLLPVVQKLRAQINAETNAESTNKILAAILVPSKELSEQVAAVSRTLCAPFNLHTQVVGGGQGMGHIKGIFRQDHPDILVATPGALVKALRRNYLDLGALHFLVIDEADTMFDPSFSELLENILQHTDIANHPRETRGLDYKAQLLLIGATFPGGVGEVLSKVTDLGNIVTIKSRMLHRLMPHVKQRFLKVKSADKILELCQALKLFQCDKKGGAALVFCNKSTTVNWLGYNLEEMGFQHARLQGEMPAAVRAGIFQCFQKGGTNVLVCTDIVSRGLDTSRVRLIINYDFPETYTDYLHRAGRVGRAGGVEHGEVLSFVTHPWDVERVQNIETAARRRATLPGMKSKIQEPKPIPVDSEESLARPGHLQDAPDHQLRLPRDPRRLPPPSRQSGESWRPGGRRGAPLRHSPVRSGAGARQRTTLPRMKSRR
ncbi:putative ATP-dependent RNA helicase DDX28 [Austrofundulus limnaeus]|uniref:RNA helicase n=1 Tax=Austrofundulus limnaeus TaxID=52670 RepID=A0A2I4AWZ8_AUSLI|nr:PREDICTED: probable ATP-dependent RNA helicase DDX28 [Austrofundulus limnaeus]